MKRLHLPKWTLYALALLLISVLEFTPGLLPEVYGCVALMPLPLVVCIAMFEGETAGALYGAAAGLLWDMQGGLVFGYDALMLLLIGAACGLLVQYLFRNTVVSGLIFVLVFTAVLELLSWCFFRSLFGRNDFMFSLMKIMLPTTLYTLVFTVPFYYGVRAMSRRLNREQTREDE